MPTLETGARNLMIDALGDAPDAGAGAGYLQSETSGDVEVARNTMADPAFGAGSAGVATANAITDDTDADGGTVDHVSMYDSDDLKILEGAAGTSGTDFIFSNLVISAGQTLAWTAFTMTMPAA